MGMSSANNVDYAVIGLYALLMVVVGLYVMRLPPRKYSAAPRLKRIT